MLDVMNANPAAVRITGTFTVEELSGDFAGARFAFARRLGECLAAVSADEWPALERALRAVWHDQQAELPWEEARPALFLSWERARKLLARVPAATPALRSSLD